MVPHNRAGKFFEALVDALLNGGSTKELAEDFLTVYPMYASVGPFIDRMHQFFAQIAAANADDDTEVAPIYTGMLWGAALLSGIRDIQELAAKK